MFGCLETPSPGPLEFHLFQEALLLSTLPDLPDASVLKKIIHPKKRRPLWPEHFLGPVSHLARPANGKDIKPSMGSLGYISEYLICITHCVGCGSYMILFKQDRKQNPFNVEFVEHIVSIEIYQLYLIYLMPQSSRKSFIQRSGGLCGLSIFWVRFPIWRDLQTAKISNHLWDLLDISQNISYVSPTV